MHVLTTAGFQALQTHRKNLGLAPHPDLTNPASVIFDQSFEHWLLIMKAGVAAEAAFRIAGGKVTEFWDEYEIRRRAKSRKNPIDWGGLEPDALIIGELNGIKHAFLPEIDRGFQAVASNAPNSIRTKGHKYRDFFIHYRQYDPLLMDLRQPTVHFITKSKERLKTIRDEIESQGGKQAYWYSTFEWTQPPYSFLGEVWQVSGRDGYHSPIGMFKP
jgi:predicted SnoaL-like aldol condensation-catalyzing enzyme